jgi:hypothetical protein
MLLVAISIYDVPIAQAAQFPRISPPIDITSGRQDLTAFTLEINGLASNPGMLFRERGDPPSPKCEAPAFNHGIGKVTRDLSQIGDKFAFGIGLVVRDQISWRSPYPPISLIPPQ